MSMGAEAVNAKNRPPQRPPNTPLTDRAKLSISGVEEVLRFDEERIVMRTTLGELAVGGSGLHVGRLSLETGELAVEGLVSELTYSERDAGGGFWSRLFG